MVSFWLAAGFLCSIVLPGFWVGKFGFGCGLSLGFVIWFLCVGKVSCSFQGA